MRTYGLSQDYQVATLAEFCYTIPPGEIGSVKSTMIVHSPDQNFLLMKRADWAALFQRHNGDLSSIGERVCNGEGSFIKEPLVPTSSQALTTYDLNMSMVDYYSGDFVYAVVSNCKNLSNAEYSLEFTNPGSFLRRHFSCQDIGLLETYACLLALFGLASYKVYWPQLKKRQDTDIYRTCYLLVGMLGGVSLFSQFAHLVVYSLDGLGMKMISYLGELAELAAKCLLVFSALCDRGRSTSGVPQASFLGHNIWWLACGLTLYLTTFFLWTQMTYKNRYVRRLRTGEGLGDFGLSVYSPLFGTSFGILTVTIQALTSGLLALKKTVDPGRQDLYLAPGAREINDHNLQNVSVVCLYFLMPLILLISPLNFPKHHEVFWLNMALHVPSLGKRGENGRKRTSKTFPFSYPPVFQRC